MQLFANFCIFLLAFRKSHSLFRAQVHSDRTVKGTWHCEKSLNTLKSLKTLWTKTLLQTVYVKAWSKGPCAKGSVTSLWCYWEAADPSRNTMRWKVMALQEIPGPRLFHFLLLPRAMKWPAIPHYALLPWCTGLPQAQSDTVMEFHDFWGLYNQNPNKLFLHSSWLSQVFSHSNRKLSNRLIDLPLPHMAFVPDDFAYISISVLSPHEKYKQVPWRATASSLYPCAVIHWGALSDCEIGSESQLLHVLQSSFLWLTFRIHMPC